MATGRRRRAATRGDEDHHSTDPADMVDMRARKMPRRHSAVTEKPALLPETINPPLKEGEFIAYICGSVQKAKQNAYLCLARVVGFCDVAKRQGGRAVLLEYWTCREHAFDIHARFAPYLFPPEGTRSIDEQPLCHLHIVLRGVNISPEGYISTPAQRDALHQLITQKPYLTENPGGGYTFPRTIWPGEGDDDVHDEGMGEGGVWVDRATQTRGKRDRRSTRTPVKRQGVSSTSSAPSSGSPSVSAAASAPSSSSRRSAPTASSLTSLALEERESTSPRRRLSTRGVTRSTRSGGGGAGGGDGRGANVDDRGSGAESGSGSDRGGGGYRGASEASDRSSRRRSASASAQPPSSTPSRSTSSSTPTSRQPTLSSFTSVPPSAVPTLPTSTDLADRLPWSTTVFPTSASAPRIRPSSTTRVKPASTQYVPTATDSPMPPADACASAVAAGEAGVSGSSRRRRGLRGDERKGCVPVGKGEGCHRSIHSVSAATTQACAIPRDAQMSASGAVGRVVEEEGVNEVRMDVVAEEPPASPLRHAGPPSAQPVPPGPEIELRFNEDALLNNDDDTEARGTRAASLQPSSSSCSNVNTTTVNDSTHTSYIDGFRLCGYRAGSSSDGTTGGDEGTCGDRGRSCSSVGGCGGGISRCRYGVVGGGGGSGGGYSIRADSCDDGGDGGGDGDRHGVEVAVTGLDLLSLAVEEVVKQQGTDPDDLVGSLSDARMDEILSQLKKVVSEYRRSRGRGTRVNATFSFMCQFLVLAAQERRPGVLGFLGRSLKECGVDASARDVAHGMLNTCLWEWLHGKVDSVKPPC